MSKVTSSPPPPPPSADDSQKQQLAAERSEESEYETISQDEDLGSPVVSPYTIDDDFSISSFRPLKRTRASEEPPTTRQTTEQPKSTPSTPSLKSHSQEQAAQEEGESSHCSSEVAAGPSDAGAARNTLSSTPSIHHQESANQQQQQQEDPGSTPKFSSLSQTSLPNNQQATMSPHARGNLSQQMNYPEEATDQSQQQPITSPPTSNSVNQQQPEQQQQQPPQQQETGHRHQVNIRVFVLQRRAPNAFAVFMHHLLNVLKVCFLVSLLYIMYNKDILPFSPSNGRDKLYVLKRM